MARELFKCNLMQNLLLIRLHEELDECGTRCTESMIKWVGSLDGLRDAWATIEVRLNKDTVQIATAAHIYSVDRARWLSSDPAWYFGLANQNTLVAPKMWWFTIHAKGRHWQSYSKECFMDESNEAVLVQLPHCSNRANYLYQTFLGEAKPKFGLSRKYSVHWMNFITNCDVNHLVGKFGITAIFIQFSYTGNMCVE